jgi:ring-1,2-phenylacetyl-CoA epoxidase subunit PaaD
MPTVNDIQAILETVSDPEIPVLSVVDLGIIRAIHPLDPEGFDIVITPTYSGCPAMNTIEVNIRAALQDHGIYNATIRTVLSPAWTTDWLSEAGRQKLKAYGIAPPQAESPDKHKLFAQEIPVPCPLCLSGNTELISQFGSTPCKSLHRCKDCLEPFDYFKCH